MAANDVVERTIYIGSDGFGEDLKSAMKEYLEAKTFQVHDMGTDTYFDIAGKVASAIIANTNHCVSSNVKPMGLLVCGTGMGVGMVANKFPNIRAATVENVTAARNARAVNDANVLCLGQLVTSQSRAKLIVDAFFDQEFCQIPKLEDDTTPAPWWSEQVADFLSTSKQGVARVEQQALSISSRTTQQDSKEE